jgi:hypothetical protein
MYAYVMDMKTRTDYVWLNPNDRLRDSAHTIGLYRYLNREGFLVTHKVEFGTDKVVDQYTFNGESALNDAVAFVDTLARQNLLILMNEPGISRGYLCTVKGPNIKNVLSEINNPFVGIFRT